MNQSRIVANIIGCTTLILVCALCCALYPGFDIVRNHWALYTGAYAILGIFGSWTSYSVRAILQLPQSSQKSQSRQLAPLPPMNHSFREHGH
jgi:hypothetical protein